LTRGNRDALPKNGVECAIGISDREQAGWPRVGSPIAVTPIAGLAMDRVPSRGPAAPAPAESPRPSRTRVSR
jgi:hypothetical protein